MGSTKIPKPPLLFGLGMTIRKGVLEVKLLSMTAENFRCYANDTFVFGPETVIRAFNGSGKSTLLECIVWCLFGTDGLGKQKADTRLLRIGEKRMSVTTTWMTDEGREIIICRTKPDTGAVTLTINGRRSKPGELEGWFGSVREFLCIFRPGTFSDLEPIRARSVLANCVPDIEDKKVMLCLPPPQRVLLQDNHFAFGIDSAKVLEKKVRAEMAECEEELVRLEGEARAFLQQLTQGIPVKPTSIVADKTKEEYARVKAQLLESPMTIDERDAQVAKLCEQRSTLRGAYRALRETRMGEFLLCPTCGQDLPEEKAVSIRESHNGDIEARLMEICEQGDALSQEIQKLQTMPLLDDAAKVAAEDFMARVEQDLRQDEERTRAYDVQLKLFERAKTSLQQTEQDKTQMEKELASLKDKLQAIRAFQSQYVRMQHAKLNGFFEDVEIRLQSVNQETGEIRDDFAVFYKGLPYKNLCRSDKIRCDVEIGRVLATPRLESLPVFVDDAEGVQDLWSLRFHGQVIAAYVYPCVLLVQSRTDSVANLLDEMKLMLSLVSEREAEKLLHPAS